MERKAKRTPKRAARPTCEHAAITCRECADFLCDYHSGDLPDAQRAEFERHLAACPPCVAYLHNYEATIALAKPALCREATLDAGTMPEALVRAILAARAKGPKKR